MKYIYIHVDIVGPLPSSGGCRYLFTAIDRATRLPEVVPMQGATTEDCLQALINGWITKFGLPDIISSDRGTVFSSNLWSALATSLGIQLNTKKA